MEIVNHSNIDNEKHTAACKRCERINHISVSFYMHFSTHHIVRAGSERYVLECRDQKLVQKYKTHKHK